MTAVAELLLVRDEVRRRKPYDARVLARDVRSRRTLEVANKLKGIGMVDIPKQNDRISVIVSEEPSFQRHVRR